MPLGPVLALSPACSIGLPAWSRRLRSHSPSQVISAFLFPRLQSRLGLRWLRLPSSGFSLALIFLVPASLPEFRAGRFFSGLCLFYWWQSAAGSFFMAAPSTLRGTWVANPTWLFCRAQL